MRVRVWRTRNRAFCFSNESSSSRYTISNPAAGSFTGKEIADPMYTVGKSAGCAVGGEAMDRFRWIWGEGAAYHLGPVLTSHTSRPQGISSPWSGAEDRVNTKHHVRSDALDPSNAGARAARPLTRHVRERGVR